MIPGPHWARARTIDAEIVYNALTHVEEKLNVSKTALDGTTCSIDWNADDFPSAYKWVPESTIFQAEFKNGSWRITGIRRDQTHRFTQRYRLVLSEKAKQALIDRYSTFRR